MASTAFSSVLRLLQFAFAIVVIGITARILDTRTFYSGKHGMDIALLCFAVFAAIAALFGLLPSVTRRAGLSVVSSIFDLLMAAFFFIAAVYTSVKIEPGYCERYSVVQDFRTGLWWKNLTCRFTDMFRALEAAVWILPFLFLFGALANLYCGAKSKMVEIDERRPDPMVEQPQARV